MSAHHFYFCVLSAFVKTKVHMHWRNFAGLLRWQEKCIEGGYLWELQKIGRIIGFYKRYSFMSCFVGFPSGLEVKVSACNVGDLGLIPGLGWFFGEGNGNPLQYSCLENPMDGGAWWATAHGVTKSQTWLSHFTSLHFCCITHRG